MRFTHLRILLFLFIAVLLSSESFSQGKWVDAVVFAKGKRIEGKVLKSFYRKPSIKIDDGHRTRWIRIKKIDSLYVNNEVYYVKHISSGYVPYKMLEKGTVTVYGNEQSMAAQIDSAQLYFLPKRNYRKAYCIFCLDTLCSEKNKMSREEFLNLIHQSNSGGKRRRVVYDSLIRSSKPVFLRASFLRPELGAELKVTNGITLGGSAGINTFGGSFRDAKTFINYDYTGQMRFYFNKERRLSKGRSLYNFSGPFFGLTYMYLIDVGRENQNLAMVTYGFQENSLFNSAFSCIRLSAGADVNTGEFYFSSILGLGWSF
jgi:hypothetical protein